MAFEDPTRLNTAEAVQSKFIQNESYLREQQRIYTGTLIQSKGIEEGGMIVQFSNGNRSFANLAEAIQFCKDNFGIINNNDGTRLCGQTIDELKEGGVL